MPHASASEQAPPLFIPQEHCDESHQPPAESEVFHGKNIRQLNPLYILKNFCKKEKK
jgi:hypothetical protein